MTFRLFPVLIFKLFLFFTPKNPKIYVLIAFGIKIPVKPIITGLSVYFRC